MFHLKYDYTYDSLGRLTSSHYSSSVSGTTGRFDESVSQQQGTGDCQTSR